MTTRPTAVRMPAFRAHDCPTWQFDQPYTIDEILQQTGTNFEYELAPVFSDVITEDGVIRVEMPHKRAVMRINPNLTTGKPEDRVIPLGVVGEGYKVHSIPTLHAINQLMLDADMYVDTYGLAGKRLEKAFLSYRIPAGVKLVTPTGEEDTTDMYLFASTAFDGSGASNFRVTGIRSWCANQWRMITATAVSKASKRHNSNLEAPDAAMIRDQLGLAYEMAGVMQETADVLAAQSMRPSDVSDFADVFFPIPEWASFREPATPGEARRLTVATKKRDKFYDLLKSESNTVWQGTGWGVFNAFTEYVDHFGTKVRDANVATARSVEGAFDRKKERALALLVRG